MKKSLFILLTAFPFTLTSCLIETKKEGNNKDDNVINNNNDPNPPSLLDSINQFNNASKVEANGDEQDIYTDGTKALVSFPGEKDLYIKEDNNLVMYTNYDDSGYGLYGSKPVTANYVVNFNNILSLLISSKTSIGDLLIDAIEDISYSSNEDIYTVNNLTTEVDFYAYMEEDTTNLFPQYEEGVPFTINEVSFKLTDYKLSYIKVVTPRLDLDIMTYEVTVTSTLDTLEYDLSYLDSNYLITESI